MNLLAHIGDKTGVLGTIISGMGCVMCFPALASIGAVIGLGFLTRWESLFVHILIPLFAGIALLANALGWFSHHQWHRSAMGMVGPSLVLIGTYAFTSHLLNPETARGLFYIGLVIMFVVAIWDLFSPATRKCSPQKITNAP